MTVVTTSQTIIDAAVGSNLSNDSDRLNGSTTTSLTLLLNVINRRVQRVYTLAGMPPERGGMSRGDYFAASTTVTVNAAAPPAAPTSAFDHLFANASGAEVRVVSRRDVARGHAELPPAIVIEDRAVKTAGRTGDPVDDDVITVHYTPLPALHTLATHYIGATTAATNTTSEWPEAVGNPWLIAELRRYLAIKRGDADPSELADIAAEINDTGTTLAELIGVNKTYLTTSESD